jgi:hypothetical protein
MVFAALLLLVELGRVFDYFLAGFRIPAVICGTAILVALLGGAVFNLKSRVGMALGAFIIWMVAVTPFSYWKGGSVAYVWQFVSLSLIAMLIFAAAPSAFGGLKKLFYGTAAFALLNVFIGQYVQPGNTDGRLDFGGTFGNSDDVAILVGFTLPFWIFFCLQIKTVLIRVPLLLVGFLVLLRIIGLTATRTALLGLGAMLVVYLARISMARRILAATVAVLGAVVIAFTLPGSVLERFATIADSFSPEAAGEQQAQTEALGSTAARRKLMADAINITFRHPLTGIGPGQFSTYRGEDSPLDYNARRSWQNTHCAYLQVSSESGILGLLFYVIFLGSIYRTIQVTRRLNSPGAHPDWVVGYQMAVCLELALVYFASCAAFMCCTEYIYQFILGGLALAAERITRFQIDVARASSAASGQLHPATPPLTPFSAFRI